MSSEHGAAARSCAATDPRVRRRTGFRVAFIAAGTRRVSLVRMGDNLAVTPAADLHVEVYARLPQSRTLGTGGSSFLRMMAAEARAPLWERLALYLERRCSSQRPT